MKSFHWFIIIGILVVGYIYLRGGDNNRYRGAARLNYDQLAVSQGLSAEARALDLERDLDVSLLPDIGKQVIREAAQQGLREQAFLQQVIQEVGNRVREISTIDLNGDDIVDPILVKPEPSSNDRFVLLSLRVPGPDSYPLPSAGDQSAWKNVETVEVATMTITLDPQALTVQAAPNRHVYPNHGGGSYAVRDSSTSFLQMYMGMRMMEWMFFPRMYGFYGPGFGYGMYSPMSVGVAGSRRGGAISQRGYGNARSSRTPAIRTRGGGAPTSTYGRAYSNRPPKSLSNLRSSASFQRRQATRVTSGGFGRSGMTAGRRPVVASRSGGFGRSSGQGLSTRATSRSRSGGFGRGFSSRSFGGGGMRFGK